MSNVEYEVVHRFRAVGAKDLAASANEVAAAQGKAAAGADKSTAAQARQAKAFNAASLNTRNLAAAAEKLGGDYERAADQIKSAKIGAQVDNQTAALGKLAPALRLNNDQIRKLAEAQIHLNQTQKAGSYRAQDLSNLTTAFWRTIKQATVTIAAYGAVLGAAAAIGSTFKEAIDFEDEMLRINTLVGVSMGLVNQWKKQLLEIGPAVGTGNNELARTLFVVTSAGIRDAITAIEVVRESAKAAAIGLGDTATVARAATAAIQAYGAQNLSASEAVNTLLETVREGNLEASSLAGVMGRVIGIGAQLGVEFGELGSFIATYTRLGVKAEEATTGLRRVLVGLLKPANQTNQELARMGLTAEALRQQIKEKGLARTLVDLANIIGDNQEQLGRLLPNVRQIAAFLGVAGEQSQAYLEITRLLTDQQETLADSFATVKAQSPGQTIKEMRSEVDSLQAQIGTDLLPALLAVVRGLKAIAGSGAITVENLAIMTTGLVAFRTALKAAAVEAGALNAVLLLNPLVLTAAAVTAAALAVNGLAKSWQKYHDEGIADATQATRDMVAEMGELDTALASADLELKKSTARDFAQRLIDARTRARELKEELEAAREAAREATQAAKDSATFRERKGTREARQAAEEAAAALIELTKRSGEADARVGDLEQGLDQLAMGIGEFGGSIAEAGEGISDFALISQKVKAAKLEDAVAAQVKAIHALVGEATFAEDALEAWVRQQILAKQASKGATSAIERFAKAAKVAQEALALQKKFNLTAAEAKRLATAVHGLGSRADATARELLALARAEEAARAESSALDKAVKGINESLDKYHESIRKAREEQLKLTSTGPAIDPKQFVETAKEIEAIRQEAERYGETIARIAAEARADAEKAKLGPQATNRLLLERLGISEDILTEDQKIALVNEEVAAIARAMPQLSQEQLDLIRETKLESAGIGDEWERIAALANIAAGAFASMGNAMGDLLSGLASGVAAFAQVVAETENKLAGILAGLQATGFDFGDTGNSALAGASGGAGIAAQFDLGPGATAIAAAAGAFVGILTDTMSKTAQAFADGAAVANGIVTNMAQGELSAEVQAITDAIADEFNAILDSTGGFVTRFTQFGILLREDAEGLRVAIDGVWRSFGDDVQGAIEYAITELVRRSEIAGVSPEVEAALASLTTNTLEELDEALALAFRQESNRLGPVLAEMRATFRQIFDDLEESISRGISIEGSVASLRALRDSVLGLEKSVAEQTAARIEAFEAERLVMEASLQVMLADLLARQAEVEARSSMTHSLVEITEAAITAEGARIRMLGEGARATITLTQSMATAIAAVMDALSAVQSLAISDAEAAAAIARAAAGSGGGFAGSAGPSGDEARRRLAILEALAAGHAELASRLEREEEILALVARGLSRAEAERMLELEAIIASGEAAEEARRAWDELSQSLLEQAAGLLAPGGLQGRIAAILDSFESAQQEIFDALAENGGMSALVLFLTDGIDAVRESFGDVVADLILQIGALENAAEEALAQLGEESLAQLGGPIAQLALESQRAAQFIADLIANMDELGLTARGIRDSAIAGILPALLDIAIQQAELVGDQEAAAAFAAQRAELERQFQRLQFEYMVAQIRLVSELTGLPLPEWFEDTVAQINELFNLPPLDPPPESAQGSPVREEVVAEAGEEVLEVVKEIDAAAEDAAGKVAGLFGGLVDTFAGMGSTLAWAHQSTTRYLAAIEALNRAVEEGEVSAEHAAQALQEVAAAALVNVADQLVSFLERWGHSAQVNAADRAALEALRWQIELARLEAEIQMLYELGFISEEVFQTMLDYLEQANEEGFPGLPPAGGSSGGTGTGTGPSLTDAQRAAQALIDTLNRLLEAAPGNMTAFEAINFEFDAYIASAQSLAAELAALGFSVEDVVAQFNELRQQRIDELFEAAGQSIQDWVDNLFGLGGVNASPLDQLIAAQSEVERLLALAQGSGAEALAAQEALPAALQALLGPNGAAAAFFGTSAGFFDLQSAILAQLAGLGITIPGGPTGLPVPGLPGTHGGLGGFPTADPLMFSGPVVTGLEIQTEQLITALGDGFEHLGSQRARGDEGIMTLMVEQTEEVAGMRRHMLRARAPIGPRAVN